MFISKSTNPSFLAFLADAQAASHKSDAQMAEELGFSRANVYTAIKNGTAKMPANKLMALATVLDASPSELLAAYLREMSPELLEAIRKVWGPTDLTRGEQKVIEAYRALAGRREVEPAIIDGKDVVALALLTA